MGFYQKNNIQLKAYSVSEELFDEILNYGYRVEIIHDEEKFNKYKTGYYERTIIRYDGYKTMILLECVLNEHYPLNRRVEAWKQCILHKNMTQINACEDDINGGMAYMKMRSIIMAHYTKDEFEACLAAHEADENPNLSQYHFQLYEGMNKIIRYDNCYKWDINGAHNDALCEIFPKAANDIKMMFETRKQNPSNKKYVNYFVGMLAKKGHRKTYNWIVQRTTKILLDGINKAGGLLLYANTDGFMVQCPNKILTHSTKLGEFKQEYCGTAWFYFDTNYQCFQLENKEITGTVLCSVRNKIDLPNNKVVHYQKVKRGNAYVAENVVEEVVTNGK